MVDPGYGDLHGVIPSYPFQIYTSYKADSGLMSPRGDQEGYLELSVYSLIFGWLSGHPWKNKQTSCTQLVQLQTHIWAFSPPFLSPFLVGLIFLCFYHTLYASELTGQNRWVVSRQRDGFKDSSRCRRGLLKSLLSFVFLPLLPAPLTNGILEQLTD